MHEAGKLIWNELMPDTRGWIVEERRGGVFRGLLSPLVQVRSLIVARDPRGYVALVARHGDSIDGGTIFGPTATGPVQTKDTFSGDAGFVPTVVGRLLSERFGITVDNRHRGMGLMACFVKTALEGLDIHVVMKASQSTWRDLQGTNDRVDSAYALDLCRVSNEAVQLQGGGQPTPELSSLMRAVVDMGLGVSR